MSTTFPGSSISSSRNSSEMLEQLIAFRNLYAELCLSRLILKACEIRSVGSRGSPPLLCSDMYSCKISISGCDKNGSFPYVRPFSQNSANADLLKQVLIADGEMNSSSVSL